MAPSSALRAPAALARRGPRVRLLRVLSRVFHGGVTAVAVGVLALIGGLGAALLLQALPSMQRFGPGFLWASQWDVQRNVYSAGPAIAGTLLTSALGLALAVPVALGVALLASEIAPRRLRGVLGYFVDLGAAIPTVVYGFWALEVLKPFMQHVVEPPLAHLAGGRGLFSGTPLGLDFLTASVILAIMLIPTVGAFAREALRAVPRSRREAALALGATRWEATRLAVLGPAAPGIVAGVALGLGRAIGETVAVALVVGGNFVLPTSLFTGGTTIATVLLDRFTDSFGLELSALYELAAILLLISFAINLGARLLLRRTARTAGAGTARSRLRRSHSGVAAAAQAASASGPTARPSWLARALGRRGARRRQRKAVHGVVVAYALGALAVAAYPLVSLVRSLVAEGGSALLTPSFYVSEPPVACPIGAATCPLGGIGPAIEGTLILLGLAAALGLPLGILAGIYLSEYGRNRWGGIVGLFVDTLAGVPSILIGVFVFGLVLSVEPTTAQNALTGALALSVLMLPIVAKATETALATVPTSVRESALALGFPRHRVTLRVVLGSCRGALVTGSLLALMRAGGETAAIVITAGSSSFWFEGFHAPVAALAPFIYFAFATSSAPNLAVDAAGAALLLLLLMAAVSLAARLAVRPAPPTDGE